MTSSSNQDVRPSLLLLTSVFPFEKGEEFIEGEMDFLAADFSEIFIAPLSYRTHMTQTRQIPVNAKLILAPAHHRSNSDVRDLLRFGAKHPGRILRSLIRAGRMSDGSAAHTVADAKFDVLTALLTEGVIQGLPQDFGVSTPAVIYSYWLHTQARVAVELHERLSFQGVPIISRGHGSDIYAEAHPSNYLPQRQHVMSKIDHVYSVSQNGADYLGQRFPFQADRVSVSHLGVRGALNPGNSSLDEKLLVTCSWIKPVKRLDLFVDALQLVQATHPQVKWVHFGTGPNVLPSNLIQYAEEHLTPGSFTFAGALSNPELREYYDTHPATAFVNVSASEGVPVSIMEALAQGLPPIATDVGGSKELINPQAGMFDGLLPANPSPQEVADRILELFDSNPEHYRIYAAASFSHWRDHWSQEANYSAFAKEISGMARRRDFATVPHTAENPLPVRRSRLLDQVTCSVVIPCYNGEDSLPRQLDALLAQDPAIIREIVVADNRSTDDTKSVIEQYARQDDRVKYVFAGRGQGPVFAQNDGVRASTHPFVMLCGADDEVQPGWATEFAQAFAAGADIVGCTIVRKAETGETLEEISALSDSSWPGMFTLGGGQAGFSRSIFNELDGLDESFDGAAEDIDFFWRAQLAGYQISFAPQARFNYYSRPTGSGILKQRMGWGRSRAQLFAKYRDKGMPRRSRYLAPLLVPYCALRLLLAGKNEIRRNSALAGLGTNLGVLSGSLRYRCWYF